MRARTCRHAAATRCAGAPVDSRPWQVGRAPTDRRARGARAYRRALACRIKAAAKRARVRASVNARPPTDTRLRARLQARSRGGTSACVQTGGRGWMRRAPIHTRPRQDARVHLQTGGRGRMCAHFLTTRLPVARTPLASTLLCTVSPPAEIKQNAKTAGVVLAFLGTPPAGSTPAVFPNEVDASGFFFAQGHRQRVPKTRKQGRRQRNLKNEGTTPARFKNQRDDASGFKLL